MTFPSWFGPGLRRLVSTELEGYAPTIHRDFDRGYIVRCHGREIYISSEDFSSNDNAKLKAKLHLLKEGLIHEQAASRRLRE